MSDPTKTSSDAAARELLHARGVNGLAELFDRYRDRLRGGVRVRLDARLCGRIDASDVVQEAFLEAEGRLAEYLKDPKLSPFVWIRFLTMQRVLILHRHHLEAKQRDARRERALDRQAPEASSVNLAALIMDSQQPTPSREAQRAEQYLQLQQGLEQMEEADREVLALRHFEHLSNEEVAEVLGISLAAASQRYYRALKKLKELLPDSLAGSSS